MKFDLAEDAAVRGEPPSHNSFEMVIVDVTHKELPNKN